MKFVANLSRALKSVVKSFVKKNSKLWNFLSKTCLLFENRFRTDDIETVLGSFSKGKKDIYFIEIGANDGVFGDPIHNFIVRDKWSGILVEPLKHIFDNLIENYQGQENLIFENVAISEKDETRDFWYLKILEEHTPKWAEGLGSFFSENVFSKSELIPNINEYIIKVQVKCVTLESLIQKHDVNRIDVFVVDTEGYDFEIIKQIDFERFKPSIIVYEHTHLRDDDKYECKRYLRRKGYRVVQKSCNTLAFK